MLNYDRIFKTQDQHFLQEFNAFPYPDFFSELKKINEEIFFCLACCNAKKLV